MTQLTDTPEGRQILLAQAIADHNVNEAIAIIDQGIIPAGKKISFPLEDGSSPKNFTAPQKWLEEGLSPLTWVVSEMLRINREENNDRMLNISAQMALLFQITTSTTASDNLSDKARESMESLTQIGGELISAGVSPDTRMGRTPRSQKALDALKYRMPDFAIAFQAAANRRKLLEIKNKFRSVETEKQEKPRPKM